MREEILGEFFRLIRLAVPHASISTVASTEDPRPVIFCTIPKESYKRTLKSPKNHYDVSAIVEISILRTEAQDGFKDLELSIQKITASVDESVFLTAKTMCELQTIETTSDHKSDTLVFSAVITYQTIYERIF